MLTKEQLLFLHSQGLSKEDTFDALGMTQSMYYPIMKRTNKLIAYNTKPCKNGHTMRTRSGHCPQCNTAYLRFSQRSNEEGFIYVAVSERKNLCKIGFTHDIRIREESLNRTYYADLNDWKIKFAVKSKCAGKIEELVKMRLCSYSYQLDYFHDGKMQVATELLNCDFKKVESAIIDACKKSQYDYKVVLNRNGENS
ncbi:MAG: GIY-YIG nuclease family protein [Parabacteroides sp.]|nr:GIY-YIG nuclease family protein [Parabacteroides sp.]